MAKWTAADIPSQDGRAAVVTGANGGVWDVSEAQTGVRFEFAGVSVPVV